MQRNIIRLWFCIINQCLCRYITNTRYQCCFTHILGQQVRPWKNACYTCRELFASIKTSLENMRFHVPCILRFFSEDKYYTKDFLRQKMFTQLTLQAIIDSCPQAHAEYRRAQERAWYGAGAHWGTLASRFLVAFWATMKPCCCRAVMPWMKLLFEPKKTCKDHRSTQNQNVRPSILRFWGYGRVRSHLARALTLILSPWAHWSPWAFCKCCIFLKHAKMKQTSRNAWHQGVFDLAAWPGLEVFTWLGFSPWQSQKPQSPANSQLFHTISTISKSAFWFPVERIWSFLRLRFFNAGLYDPEVERLRGWVEKRWRSFMKSRQRWMKCKLDRETGGRSMEKRVASILMWHVAESKSRRFKVLDYISASM